MSAGINQSNRLRIVATSLGVIGAVLWFMPFVEVRFMGVSAFQTGSHIGGIAYLLLLACFAYAALSWMNMHVPRAIAAFTGLAICLLFIAQAGSATMWGLGTLSVVMVASAALALIDCRREARSAAASCTFDDSLQATRGARQ